MGEAKRRKKLDPNYGKIPRLRGNSKRLQKKALNLYFSTLAKNGYERHGRGYISFNKPVDESEKLAPSNFANYISLSELDSMLKEVRSQEVFSSKEENKNEDEISNEKDYLRENFSTQQSSSISSEIQAYLDLCDCYEELSKAINEYDPNSEMLILDPFTFKIETLKLSLSELDSIEKLNLKF
ncbi:MAG: hypothetical protein ACFBSE_16185 [Prochloraceae cyanobacterium]